MSDKNTLRENALKSRDAVSLADNASASRMVCAQIIMLPELDEIKVISGYYPMRIELNSLTILKALHAARFPIALPTIISDDEPLEFRRWDMRTELVDGPFGTKQSTQEVVVPEILIVPLAAFDLKGNRIGYGGGYYDRTLSVLRKNNPDVIAIGVAFDDQKLDSIPAEDYDQPLDLVVTEKTIYRVK
ncbi:MAG: 5-formyltetrahydrofolate cyclo-ligase [Kordiimonadaceae bacterium]|jgi:5-formyltetrahydrofolate cyclo-ligase|nr:5-formyltetrahydrofolate cyclo-ligase [Kordiimonadaceae bacterium]MBT6035611.1 5-formyltetrahydrofolate cyclo-ligase [Kordiimonadaceae bacterium]MBT6330757.1 5-formyltetrahydrofolate cyclo-ligase [Kordiimonadaceae bacterium]MBT7581351.1 5-formyltetrahydrofolate cyclo-ligase [Kordiimonadaceae bacterium]